jgi:hypothetical protein
MRTIVRQTSRKVSSLGTETYWSRGAFAFGPVAVKFRLQPAEMAGGQSGDSSAPDLRAEFKSRLGAGDVRFDLKAQRYANDETTPIENETVEWKEEVAPFVTIAHLTIPAQELNEVDEAEINGYAFNPWNTSSEDIRPIGSMNRARKMVYYASAKLRGAG